MRRTLLVTNDFPPRTGGIQSYVYELARRLPPDRLTVYTSSWRGDAEFDAAQAFPVARHHSSLMVPTTAVARRAAALAREHGATTVWFGAAAPLALLTPSLRKHGGVIRAVGSTHGHEVGWSMMPGSRQALRAIGRHTDVLTFVSRYTRGRFAAAFGPDAAFEYLPAGVDTEVFRPDRSARERIRGELGLGERPVIACISRLVPRKGQDSLIRAMPAILTARPDAVLLIVGGGPYREKLGKLAASTGVTDSVVLTGGVPFTELPGHYAAADLFAMPCRTRGGGLDVEGLGIVFLEASACRLPVVAGDSGGAPEAVQEGRTGTVVDGRDIVAVAAACVDLLDDPARRVEWGAAGQAWVQERWNWEKSADRLAELLSD